MRALPYWLAYLIPGTVVVGYVGGGWWTFLTAVSVYVLIPPLDAALGTDPRNPAEVHLIRDADQRSVLNNFIKVYPGRILQGIRSSESEAI